MRANSSNSITYSSQAAVTGPGFRVEYLQGEDPVALMARAQAIIDELVALLPGEEWEMPFVHLAGGGEGHLFTLTMEFADDAAAQVTTVGFDLAEAESYSTLASEEGAWTRREDAAIAALFASLGPTDDLEVRQTLVAGASSGRRFGAVTLAEREQAG